jgi:hypothetical protein
MSKHHPDKFIMSKHHPDKFIMSKHHPDGTHCVSLFFHNDQRTETGNCCIASV